MKEFAPDGQTLIDFMADYESRVRIAQGPVGSGTSSACCLNIYQHALAQPKQSDGRQRFRAHVLRDTFPKLEETTVRTWLDWFPPGNGPGQFGTFYWSKPFRHEIRVGPLELDVTFMAMEDVRDAESYAKSLDTSMIWINEGRFFDLGFVSALAERVSPPRFPANKDGGCTLGGMIIDTNAPPSDHWIPIMRGDTPVPDWMTADQRRSLAKPYNWRFFMQPPGLIEILDERGEIKGYRPNPDAENLKHLHKPGVDPMGPHNFYMEKLGAQTVQWIDANIMNRSAVVIDGRPVYPLFRREVNVSKARLEPIAGLKVQIGLDFGRNPAALMGQQLRGDWFIQREYIGRNMSASEFAPLLRSYLAETYPKFEFIFWGDPAGGQRGQANDETPFEVFRQHGMNVLPAPDAQNRQSLRQEAVNGVLMRRSMGGGPTALIVDPGCTTYITGMSGGYNMRRLRVSGERYSDEPEKNQYSHVCEGGEYLLLGGGEGRSVLTGGTGKARNVQTKVPYNPLARPQTGVQRW